MSTLTPSAIVTELDRYIVGQGAAKKAVAIALRNRWRRQQVPEPWCSEITPKNILMIGPTGVGKTEIARRLARLTRSPFIKVEATKFTEVGYVGRDVESIIRDLVDMAVKETREEEKNLMRERARERAMERLLDALFLPPSAWEKDQGAESHAATRAWLKNKIQKGEMDSREVEIEVAASQAHLEILAPPGMEEITSQIQGMLSGMVGGKKRARTLRVPEALLLLEEEEAAKLVDEEAVRAKARRAVEENGIVFLDEIDKITSRGSSWGADVSREGVQRDLLPLVEGTSISTKHGVVRTDHILFIASGAFQMAKPSDLIPELQGRLPIRVELSSLTVDDFEKILTQTENSLIAQYQALLATEGVQIDFTREAVRKIAEVAHAVNASTENIGARRLATVMEKLLEDISFHAGEKGREEVCIGVEEVEKRLGDLSRNQDLARYIL